MRSGSPVRAVRDALTHARPPFMLCYHGVGRPRGGDNSRGLFVSPEQFSHHVDVIQSQGYELLTVSELWRRLSVNDRLDGVAAITFDDAFEQTAEHAMAELSARKLPSTMYVPTGMLGEPHPHVDGERIMDAAAVSDLVSAGVEVGGHTVDHPRLTELGYDAALEQMRRSRDDLEQLLGAPVRSMAYPFGAYDGQTIRAASAAGYETACACDGAGPWEPLRLPREPVFPSITTFRLRLKMAGLYGPASRIAEIRNRLFSRR